MLDADEIANAVEARLRVGAQVVVEQDQHAVIAKTRALIGQMGGVAGHLDHLRDFHQKRVERIVRQRVMTPESVGGVDSFDGIPKRADDFA